MDLLAAAKEAVAGATAAGAGSADALALERRETSLTIRRGDLETSQEAETRGVGVRAFRGGRSGIAYTTDLTPESLRRAGRQAADLAALAGMDPAAGLPDPAFRGAPAAVEGIDDPDYESVEASRGIAMAKEGEAAAFAADRRVVNSEGTQFEAARQRTALAASDGFEARSQRTRYSLAVMALAEDEGGALQRDGWYTCSPILARLDPPEAVGREAARRCVRRLGWRKVETRRVPVVFSPEVAAAFAGEVARACCGDALFRGASFLADSLGEAVASPLLTLVDDPLLAGGLGSRPFDAEGARPARKAVLDRGILRSFLFDSFSLRKTAAAFPARAAGGTPGNATRGLGGPTAVGTSNLFVEAGAETPEAVIGAVQDGFYVTETLGFGVNTATGDYSKGAAGLWIRDGALGHAVQEVTIAADLRAMLRGVAAVGNDLEFRSSVSAPTIRIAEMTVSGN